MPFATRCKPHKPQYVKSRREAAGTMNNRALARFPLPREWPL
jgi:hypothetical protein